ncbi:MerR family transcriptional regulator [Paenibacillus methanolicus]|uniref:DNA-binding transcriptional MerR regulator n=1 Tax=Paenibacillus methanolicus TaxID=582686 RepID=A0A5S5CB47_9BACL|nr:MerR family transcriptional regulator [Paenibacillus methanolicus]TYP76605.1 DNA-binding transcriptional MerR regulator [Paenibacillus methanolicus]
MEQTKYTAGQLADVAGTTVRTVQYYDQIGLLNAERSGGKRIRTYDDADLVKLQQILFYKKLGLSLKEIQHSCLRYEQAEDLKRILARQNELLFRKETEIRSNRAIIEAILSAIEAGHHCDLEQMVKLTLGLNRDTIFEYERLRLDPDTVTVFGQYEIDGEKAAAIYWQWKKLLVEAVLLKFVGIQPDSDAGYQLGKKWGVFVRNATNGNEELADAYYAARRQSHLWPEEDRLLMDACEGYLEQSYRYFLIREGDGHDEVEQSCL